MLNKLLVLAVAAGGALTLADCAMEAEALRDYHVPATFSVESLSSHRSLRSRQIDQAEMTDEEPWSTPDPTNKERLLVARSHHEWQGVSSSNRKLQDVKVIEIPVYAHVLLAQGATPLPDRQIRRFVKTLNKGFDSSPFDFVLYGSDVTFNNTYAECREEAAFKQETRAKVVLDGPDVLHVWICDTNAGSPGSVGYSYYPPITQREERYLDGVVVMTPRTTVFGQLSVFYSLVHEVGHWLGLLHTFDGGCDTQKKAHWGAYESYNLMGDGVMDTPAHSGPTVVVQDGASSCWQNMSPKLNTCPDTSESKASGMDVGDDPVDNFMNYMPGNCYAKFGRFTAGQVERMVSQYGAFRYSNVTRAPPAKDMAVVKKNRLSTRCARSHLSVCTSSSDCCGRQRCISWGGTRGKPESKCRPCRKRADTCKSDGECCQGMACRLSKCQLV